MSQNDSLLLAALLDLARSDVPATAIRLAARLERGSDEVRRDLQRLDRAGYVDAERCRLTFGGLVVAADAIRSLAAPSRVRRAA